MNITNFDPNKTVIPVLLTQPTSNVRVQELTEDILDHETTTLVQIYTGIFWLYCKKKNNIQIDEIEQTLKNPEVQRKLEQLTGSDTFESYTFHLMKASADMENPYLQKFFLKRLTDLFHRNFRNKALLIRSPLDMNSQEDLKVFQFLEANNFKSLNHFFDSFNIPKIFSDQFFSLYNTYKEELSAFDWFRYNTSLKYLLKLFDVESRSPFQPSFVPEEFLKKTLPTFYSKASSRTGDLPELTAFVRNNKDLLKNRNLQKFIQQQFIDIYLDIKVKHLKEKDNAYRPDPAYYSKDLYLIIEDPEIPLPIRYVVKTIIEHQNIDHSPAIVDRICKNDKKEDSTQGIQKITTAFTACMGEKLLAIDAANEIDGYDFRTGGIRLAVHQPRKDGELYRYQLVEKLLLEFISGRRKIIFQFCDTTGCENYKILMKYIITGLKEDRTAYYAQNPTYIDEKILETFDASTSKKPEDKYVFEYYSRKLITLEDEIENAKAEEEIYSCLDKFRDIYQHIPNENIDLTVVTTISISCLYKKYHLKPVIHYDIPPKLKALAVMMDVLKKDKSVNVFQSLYDLIAQVSLKESASEIEHRVQDLITSVSNDSEENYLPNLLNKLIALKYYIGNHLYDYQVSAVNALNTIQQFEDAIAIRLLSDLDQLSPESFELLSKICLSRGYTCSKFHDVDSLKTQLNLKQKEIQSLTKKLRSYLANSSISHLIFWLKKLTMDQQVQNISGSFNSGVLNRLGAIVEAQTSESLQGISNTNTALIGKIRIVKPEEDISVPQKDEILVMIAPDANVYKYAGAKAIISEQGGLFSHAAIAFSELSIPAHLGADLNQFKPFNGQYVLLKLGKSASIREIPKDALKIFETLPDLSMETAIAIEKLPQDISKPIAKEFYDLVFEDLPSTDWQKFMHFSYAQHHLEAERKKIIKMQTRLWKASHPMERGFILKQIEQRQQKLNKLTPSEDFHLEQIQFNQKIASLEVQHINFGMSSKKGNLDRLQGYLSPLEKISIGLHQEFVTVKIPTYCSFDSKTLIWDRYPQVKLAIEAILKDDKLNYVAKSEKISTLLKENINIDEDELKANISLEGKLIVRSSAKLEDLATTAASGVFNSVCVDESKTISQAFLEVLKSAFSEKALTYYKQQGFIDNPAIFDMTWLVQEYKSDGTYSGVGFSVSGENKWHISGVQIVSGLGGGVDAKSGQNPSYVFYDKRYSRLQDIHYNNQKDKLPCSIDLIKGINNVLKELEVAFKSPVEIEFVGNEKELFIVQLRPITHHPK